MMNERFVLPPSPTHRVGTDPLEEEILELTRGRIPQKSGPDGRFLPPGQKSLKAQGLGAPLDAYGKPLSMEVRQAREAELHGAEPPPPIPNLPEQSFDREHYEHYDRSERERSGEDRPTPALTAEEIRTQHRERWQQQKAPPPPTRSTVPVEIRAKYRPLPSGANAQTQPVPEQIVQERSPQSHLEWLEGAAHYSEQQAAPTPTQTPPPPSHLSGPCQSEVFVRLAGRRLLLTCTLQGPHPGQPHMIQLEPIEPGDSIFLGFYHEGE